MQINLGDPQDPHLCEHLRSIIIIKKVTEKIEYL